MKSYCRACHRFLNTKQFHEREDRSGYYAFCKGCMRKKPLYITVEVNDDEIQVLEKEYRTREYPAIEDRGYGAIR